MELAKILQKRNHLIIHSGWGKNLAELRTGGREPHQQATGAVGRSDQQSWTELDAGHRITARPAYHHWRSPRTSCSQSTRAGRPHPSTALDRRTHRPAKSGSPASRMANGIRHKTRTPSSARPPLPRMEANGRRTHR